VFLILAPYSFASPQRNNEMPFQTGRNPFEPTVTRQESELLDAAIKKAGEDPAEAIRMLQTENLREASPAVDFAIGNLYSQQDNLGKAAAAYEAALAKLPKFKSAIVNLGRIYIMQDKMDKSIKLYQKLVAEGQANADILLLLGHALLKQECPVSAEAAYRQSLLLRPKQAEAMRGLAKSLIRQERFREGLALVGEILQQTPGDEQLWSLRVNALLSMGEYETAIRMLEQAKRLQCVNAEMRATLGDLYLNRQQPEDALQAYQAAFRDANPSVQRILRALKGFLMLGNYDEAKRMVARAERIQQEKPQAFECKEELTLLRLKGKLAHQQGQKEEALNIYSEILRQDPVDGKTMLLLAELQQELGKLEDAVMTCERAAGIDGCQADALILQGQIEVQRKNYRQALKLLQKAQSFENRPYVARYIKQVQRMAD